VILTDPSPSVTWQVEQEGENVMKRVVPLMIAGLVGLIPGQASGKKAVTPEDCDRAISETAQAYEQGRQPDDESEQLARRCSTIAYAEDIGTEDVDIDGAGSTGRITTASTGSGCRTIADGRIYFNGFGQQIIRFVGYLRGCFYRGHMTGGDFWTSIDSCCFWFYEGIVDSNNGGCFRGCGFVSRYRRGSFIYNPPYPAITTRVQPWFRLRVNGDGTATHSAGD
jgi:hypothetical protein